MRAVRLLLTVTVAAATALGLLAGPSSASAATEPVTVALAAPPAYADSATTVTVDLTWQDAPLSGATVVIERQRDGAWEQVAELVTDAGGRAATQVILLRAPADNFVRATTPPTDQHAGGSAEYAVPLVKRDSRVVLRGPDAFTDETSAPLTIRWRAVGAGPVDGEVRLMSREAGQRTWRVARTAQTGDDGEVTVTVSPRVDSRWRAVATGLPWVRRGRSDVHLLDNRPPIPPVNLPRGAPAPRLSLPPQRRAVGTGANPSITRIPGSVWRQMTGRSWHRGCPVGRAGLRLVRINYWDYTGYRRRGELVAAKSVAPQIARALRAMYAAELPIRAMYRVDRFGWSDRLQGADDYASMAAGNTSAFNCRHVVGHPGVRSPHSYGRSLDVNPWENPYRSRQGVYPNSWWLGRSHPRIAWRSRAHAVVQIMARHGLRWTYGRRDLHHFDAVPPGGRLLKSSVCASRVCH